MSPAVGSRRSGSSRSRHGGSGSKIAIALRALTIERVIFWANSKKVRIGPIR